MKLVSLIDLSRKPNASIHSPSHLIKDLSFVVLGGDPGQPNGASKTEEHGAARGEQTASAAGGEVGKVAYLFFSPLALTRPGVFKG